MVWSNNENWLVTGDNGGRDIVIISVRWLIFSGRHHQVLAEQHEQFEGVSGSQRSNSQHSVRLADGHRWLTSLSFCPTDMKFATCSDDVTIKIWDFMRCQDEKTLSGHGWDVKCISWHPSKALLVSGSKDNLIKLWDPRSGKNTYTIHGHKSTGTLRCRVTFLSKLAFVVDS
jgi:polyadenylation factor subunit 2